MAVVCAEDDLAPVGREGWVEVAYPTVARQLDLAGAVGIHHVDLVCTQCLVEAMEYDSLAIRGERRIGRYPRFERSGGKGREKAARASPISVYNFDARITVEHDLSSVG